MDLVSFDLQYCCDTALRNLSIDTRWQHGGITTSTRLRNVLDVITYCVKDEAKKLRIYSELDDALVNGRLDSWRQRVVDSLWASRQKAGSEEAQEDTGTGQEPSALEPKASKETAAPAPRKKRGRPPIPEERKRRALKAREEGKSLKEQAAILYDTRHPDRRQQSDVSNVLKYYQNQKHSK